MEENLKVILIDDEMLIRKLIRMKIDRENLHLEIVGEFGNGASALEEIPTLQPDIVISDICMPEIDGISFSEKCVEILPIVKIIIVTGYDDFNYARRSLKAGVFDYLMKPVQSEELNNTLQRAIREIRKEKDQMEQQERFLLNMKKNLPTLRSIYLNQLLIEEVLDQEFKEKLYEYGVIEEYQENNAFQISILAIRESLEHPDLSGKIAKEAELFFESEPHIWAIQDSWGRIVIINSEADMSFSGCLDLLIQMVEKQYDCHIQLGISSKHCGWKEIHNAYINALDDYQQKHANKHVHNGESSIGNSIDWKKLNQLIEKGRAEEAVIAVEDTLKELFSEDNDKGNLSKASMLLQKICIDTELSQNQMQTEHILKLCRSVKDLTWAVKFQVRMMSMEKAMENDIEKGVKIREIIAYIRQNIDHQELSMNLLSNEFFISTSYLSRLFRTITGESYGDLISDFRLLKMMELLNSTDMRDRDIGRQIGIEDAHYLSIWFRKMTGYSVTEYRKLNL